MKSHFVRRWFWWIFAALVIAVLAWPRAEADVYIDPDATCHGAGTISAPLCAWPSVYAGGETYRQKRGTTTASTIRITSRTNPDALLTLGTYGEGARPIIDASADVPGITDPARWTGAEDVWRFAHGYRAQPLVLAINGRRLLGPAITMAELCSAPGSQTIMYATDASYLNLCSVTNPAAWIRTAIANIPATGKSTHAPVWLENQRHVLIDGLDLRGGAAGALEIREASSDIEVRNSAIGWGSPSGVRIYSTGQPVARINIHHNVIDSGVRWGDVNTEVGMSGEGVHLNWRVVDSEVADNEIAAWTHNGVYLDGHLAGAQIQRNRILRNDIHCGPGGAFFDYCRPVGIDGGAVGAASGNLVAWNHWHDVSVGAQLNGDHNVIAWNLCERVRNSGAKRNPTGQCIRIQGYGVSESNSFVGNLLRQTENEPVQILGGAFPVRGHVFSGNQVECAETCVRIGPGVEGVTLAD